MISVLPYNASDARLIEIQECFTESWRIYADSFRNTEPETSTLFREYASQVPRDGDLSEPKFNDAHCGPNCQFFVAYSGGKAVAGIVAAKLLARSPDSGAIECELWRMAVRPEFRKKGVARKLNTAVWHWAAGRNASCVWLTTGMIMSSANKLYSALGYELVKRHYEPLYKGMVNHYVHSLSEEDRLRAWKWRVVVSAENDGSLVAKARGREVGRLEDGWRLVHIADPEVKKSLLQFRENAARKSGHSGVIRVGGETLFPGNSWNRNEVSVSVWKGEQVSELYALFSAAWTENSAVLANVDPSLSRMLTQYALDTMDNDFPRLLEMHERVWVAKIRNRIVGMVTLLRGGELKKLALHPAAVGMGIASKLVSTLEAHCRKVGYEKVFLSTGAFMPVALRFYHRIGYVRLPGYSLYPFPNVPGGVVGVVKFERKLNK